MTRPTTITIDITGTADLAVANVWPDGDAPDVPTAADVLARLTERGLLRGITDWALPIGVQVRVDAPNPAHTQADALFPELAPPARMTTTAEEWE